MCEIAFAFCCAILYNNKYYNMVLWNIKRHTQKKRVPKNKTQFTTFQKFHIIQNQSKVFRKNVEQLSNEICNKNYIYNLHFNFVASNFFSCKKH